MKSITSTFPPAATPARSVRDDVRTIGLIGLAHGTSHFFHLLLPPLFPWFIRESGFTYSELGLLVTVFFLISGLGQASAGFVVDRMGARPVLFVAVACFVAAGLAGAVLPGYGGLMVAAALAGLGNAPFHPIDFTILNKRVSAPRLGHGFSVHGISGNLGWAAAPVFLTGVTALTGSWRMAMLAAAVLALVVLVILFAGRDAIDDRQGAWAHETAAKHGGKPAPAAHPFAFLREPSVWLCFSFFFFSTCALSAIQGFSSPALQQIYGLPLGITSLVVTGFMLCGAGGMLIGGFLVARAERLEQIIGVCLLASAVLLGLVGLGILPGMVAVAFAALAGLGTGLAGPSRDMLIKRAAPPGATGRVYGTVYSGLDLGFAMASPLFGALLDRGQAGGVFYGSAFALLLGVASAAVVGARIAGARR
jgi:FSR family fosmidomycin resistance protein-like MFS transporter